MFDFIFSKQGFHFEAVPRGNPLFETKR